MDRVSGANAKISKISREGPAGVLVTVTVVSGAGKSTLVHR